MNFLKNNIFLFLVFLSSCTSSSYKANLDKDLGGDIIATPDRFLPYCEKVTMDDGTIAYGFVIFFLDEEETIGTATGKLTTKKACLKWKSGSQKILDTGRLISLKGFGNIEKPRVVGEYSYTFKDHGTFHSNERSMAFFSIRNDQGGCFSVDSAWCKN